MDQMTGVPADPTWWHSVGYALGGVFAAMGGRRFLDRRRQDEETVLTCNDVVKSIDKMSADLTQMIDLMSNEFSNEMHRARVEFRAQGKGTTEALVNIAKDTAILMDRTANHPPGG